MFFIGLTLSQTILMTGVVLLFLQSYLVGGPVAVLGACASYVLFRFYEKRKKAREKKKKSDWISDCCDPLECIDIPSPKRFDCDCTPDCWN
ncbi:hypothetical protein [Robertmurraya kyonggiensis]|uniref:Uncharacterized protein n=1 Tax=Robertmurraya kyonggiensis TaxID=1037680 RepID=A0A4U1DB55_9BACI|nr:hypothetical protein [Robertmurraya kyonggiensis]TKC19802.1 hypothetical protein FA727_09780 [Robertmurraya kyonggiensis]